MFKLIESEKEIKLVRAFCSDGYFGARINTSLAAYGTDDRFVRTWYEEQGGKAVAVMQLTEGAAVVKATPAADFESLAALLLFTGAQAVIGTAESIARLPFFVQERGVLMRTEKPAAPTLEADLTDSEQLHLLYPVLFGEETAADRRAYMAWLADLSHRVRHGHCTCFGVWDKEEIVSCAHILYSNAKYGCIGAVATRPSHRKQGFGEACTLTAAQFVLKYGQIPCLACADNGIEKWYEKMGFAVFDKWMMMQLNA